MATQLGICLRARPCIRFGSTITIMAELADLGTPDAGGYQCKPAIQCPDRARLDDPPMIGASLVHGADFHSRISLCGQYPLELRAHLVANVISVLVVGLPAPRHQ